MAKAKVQGEYSGYYAGTPVTATFGSTPTQGNLLIAVGRGQTDPVSNASIAGWTLAGNVRCGSALWMGLWFKVAGAGESTTVSLAWTGSTDLYLTIEEWGGIVNAQVSQSAFSTYTSGVTSKTSGTTGTTTSDEIAFAVHGHGGAYTSPSWTNSFSQEAVRPTGNLLYALASRVITSAATYETTMSWTTARYCGGLIVTFRDGTEEHSGSAAISGNGANAGSGTKSGLGAALASANGALVTLGLAGMLGLAAISGGGTLSSSGTAAEARYGTASVSGGGVQTTIGTKAAYSNPSAAIPDIGAYEYQGSFGLVISGNGSLTTAGFGAVGEPEPKIVSISGGGSLAGEGTKSASNTTSISGAGFISGIPSADADFAIFWDGWTGNRTWTENEVEIAVEDLMTGVI